MTSGCNPIGAGRVSEAKACLMKRFRIRITIKKFERIELNTDKFGFELFEHCLN